MRIVRTHVYERHVRKLLSPEEQGLAEEQIAFSPERWPIIPGTGGARKARVARPGMGKRGGARLIYFVVTAKGWIYLMDVHAKNTKENLTNVDKKDIRDIIEALKSEA